jgi:signal transduction histidine kinase
MIEAASMTLRAKLVLALTLVALVPMGVALALPMLQADRRAREAASRHLETVRRQTGILIEREKREVAARVAQVADDLVRERPERQPLWHGPAAARPVALALAERYGLDHLEVRDARGAFLAASDADPRSDPVADLSLLHDGEVAFRPLPYPASAADRRAGYFARQPAVVGRATVTLIGGRVVGRALLEAVHEITEQPAELVDDSGQVVEAIGEPAGATPRIDVEIGLQARAEGGVGPSGGGPAGGWLIRMSVPAGDARETRHALLLAFAGTAPLAIASALLVGVFLAGGISRPIRALAARAESTAAAAAGGALSPIPGGDEVKRLALAFDRMLVALAASERERVAVERVAAWQEVAKRIAHEVKNPLSPIRLAVENLRRTRQKAPQDFDRSFDEETATILEEVEQLRRLVEEFSSFARLPPPQAVPCDLRQVLAQTLGLFGTRIQSAGIRVETADGDLTGTVQADPGQIGRALKNIVANAIEAMEESGPERERRLSITLRTAASPPGGGARFAEIEVRDTGVGLDPEVRSRLFEPYFTTRAGRGGSGLGMAIAHRIATDHGGGIRAEGAPGKGAAITLRLPLEGPPAARPGPTPVRPGPAGA